MTVSVQELFGHSFVISIYDERLQVFKQRFQKEGLPMPRVFTGFQYKNGVYKTAGIVKTRNTANVRLSNLAIVKAAEALDWPFVCVFEDDALPCISAKQKLEDLLHQLPDDIDMLKLGWLCKSNIVDMHNGLQCAQTFGSHAYIVFSKHYKRFQDNTTRLFITDTFPMNDPSSNILCASQLLFIQDDRCFETESVHTTVGTLYFSQLSASGQLSSFNV